MPAFGLFGVKWCCPSSEESPSDLLAIVFYCPFSFSCELCTPSVSLSLCVSPRSPPPSWCPLLCFVSSERTIIQKTYSKEKKRVPPNNSSTTTHTLFHFFNFFTIFSFSPDWKIIHLISIQHLLLLAWTHYKMGDFSNWNTLTTFSPLQICFLESNWICRFYSVERLFI